MNKDLLYTILEMRHDSVANHELTIRPLMEAGDILTNDIYGLSKCTCDANK